MKGKISIDFDGIDNIDAIGPVIRVQICNTSPDPRDRLLSCFFSDLAHKSQWLYAKHGGDLNMGEKDQFTHWNLYPIKPKHLLEHSRFMKEATGETQYVNVWGNSDAFREFLDKQKISWKSNDHYTLVDDKIDLFDLGQKFEMFKTQHNAKLA